MLCQALLIVATGCLSPQGSVVSLTKETSDLRDPRLDGWTTEAFAEDVVNALDPWKEELAHGAPNPHPFEKVALHLPAADDWQTPRSTPSFQSRRFAAAPDQERREPAAAQNGLAALTAILRGPLKGEAQAKIKVTGVGAPASDDLWRAELLIEVGGHSDQVGWHGVAVGTTVWAKTPVSLEFRSFTLLSGETTELKIEGGQLFEDVTASLLADSAEWHEQLLVGQDRWARTVEERLGMGLYRHSGVAVGDANGDGLEDLYVAQPAGLPNLLLLKAPDGGLHNAALEAGVDWLDHTSSALFADLDADGDADLVATVAGGVVIHENLGRGEEGSDAPRFKAHPPLLGTDTDLYGLSVADVDLDGDLDVYVTADFANKRKGDETKERARFDYVDANDGGRNVLWRNDGDLRFVDATKALGLEVNNRRHSLAATWRDLDQDGDADLYVANDYGHNCLYLNQSDLGSARIGPLFKESAEAWGVEDRGSGMSIDVGDPNRDGRLDLLVANMWSSAGRRVVPQAAFGAAGSAAERDQFSRFAKGNTLFVCAAPTEDGSTAEATRFMEASRGSNIERGRWAWSTPFVDLDGDGWEDILVGNGYVTSHQTSDL